MADPEYTSFVGRIIFEYLITQKGFILVGGARPSADGLGPRLARNNTRMSVDQTRGSGQMDELEPIGQLRFVQAINNSHQGRVGQDSDDWAAAE